MNTILSQDTAILFFANSAIVDARLKKMSGEPRLVLECLTEQTLQTLRATGLPYFHFSETKQKGSDFGERFSNAIQEIADLGYTKIITVGNDSPNLSVKHIEKAVFHLSNDKSVIGPSRDGGCYLIAFHTEDFHTKDFAALPWQTASLLGALSGFLSSGYAPVQLLNLLDDIDSIPDIKRLSNFLKKIGLKWIQLFSKLCLSHGPIWSASMGLSQYYYSNIPFNKGSPQSFVRL